MYCSVLQRVAVCCCVLQCVEEVQGRSHVVSCTQPGVLQCVTKYCDVLRCVAVCCGVLHRAEKAQERARCESCLRALSLRCSVLRCVAVCCIEQRRHRTKQDVSLADMHSHYVTQVRSGVLVAASSCVHVMFFSNTPDQGNSSLAYMHRVAEVCRGLYACVCIFVRVYMYVCMYLRKGTV